MPKKGIWKLGTGPFLAHPEQTHTTVEAGTEGRLLRLCMNIARNHPEWVPIGPIIREPKVGSHQGKNDPVVLRQKLCRRQQG